MIKDKLSQETDNPNGTISLKQRGPPLRIEVSPKNMPRKGVTCTELIDWMRTKSLCLEQMKNLSKFIRKHFGKFSVEDYTEEKIADFSHQLDDHFELVELEFIDSNGSIVTKRVPVVNDPTDLVHCLHEKMGLDTNETFLKVGIDAGHGSLKVKLLINVFIASYKRMYSVLRFVFLWLRNLTMTPWKMI